MNGLLVTGRRILFGCTLASLLVASSRKLPDDGRDNPATGAPERRN